MQHGLARPDEPAMMTALVDLERQLGFSLPDLERNPL